MTTPFGFLHDLADEREEEAIETTPLLARGGVREYSGSLRVDSLRAPTLDYELEGEASRAAFLTGGS
jgi:hypothetical protein